MQRMGNLCNSFFAGASKYLDMDRDHQTMGRRSATARMVLHQQKLAFNQERSTLKEYRTYSTKQEWVYKVGIQATKMWKISAEYATERLPNDCAWITDMKWFVKPHISHSYKFLVFFCISPNDLSKRTILAAPRPSRSPISAPKCVGCRQWGGLALRCGPSQSPTCWLAPPSAHPA